MPSSASLCVRSRFTLTGLDVRKQAAPTLEGQDDGDDEEITFRLAPQSIIKEKQNRLFIGKKEQTNKPFF